MGEKVTKFIERLEKIYEDRSHPVENLKIIKFFIAEVSNTGLSEETIKSYYSAFNVFSKWCTRPIIELTRVDITEFLEYLNAHTYIVKGKDGCYSASTKHTYKIVYKKFFNALDSHFFKALGLTADKTDLAISFKEKTPRKKKLDKKSLLTEEEVFALVNAAVNPRDKAIIMILFESGVRRGELLSVKIKHINFEFERYCDMHIAESKTTERDITLVLSRSYLRAWVESHPQRLSDGRPDPEAYICVSLHGHKDKGTGKMVYKRISEQGMYNQIQKIGNRIGIKKKINPHSFRHACATTLVDDPNISDQVLKETMGWTPSSNMANIYIHKPDTKKAKLRMHGIEPEEEIKITSGIRRCYNCKQEIPEKASWCPYCGYAPSVQKCDLEKETTGIESLIMNALMQNPAILEEITRRLTNTQIQ